MQITLINCLAKLQALGINMNSGNGVDALCSQLLSDMPDMQSFGYGFAEDTLTIEVPNGTSIPDLSSYGQVVPI